MDVSTLAKRELKHYAEYLDDMEFDWIDYGESIKLDYTNWQERENPCDPDTDA